MRDLKETRSATEDGVTKLGREGDEVIFLQVSSFLNEADMNLSIGMVEMGIEGITSSTNKDSKVVEMILVDDNEDSKVIANCDPALADELMQSAYFEDGCIVGLENYTVLPEASDGT